MNHNSFTPAQTRVRVENLERTFGSGGSAVHVLQGLDLTVFGGKLVALYGPSGSGKTTLLNLIGALDHPTGGTVAIDGRDITRLSEGARARLRRTQIGFIFQGDTLLPTYSALENIELALRLLRLGFRERRRRSRSTLEAVGLSAWADHVPDELSGGQRQRVVIARALALHPALVLADEPTSGLDTRTSRQILTLFRGVAAAQDTAFIIASHDPVIIEYADKAFDLYEGKLVPRALPDVPTTAIKDPQGEPRHV